MPSPIGRQATRNGGSAWKREWGHTNGARWPAGANEKALMSGAVTTAETLWAGPSEVIWKWSGEFSEHVGDRVGTP